MKFTLSWLKNHLETDASTAEIGEKLTDIGLELEEIEDRAALFAPFKAAYVESAEQHPDADRLRVCMVKTADHGTMQVVCGAPNARTGMTGIFAPEGSTIPGTGDVLKKGKIRGVESCGMLVSEREMGLSDDHEGIIELPEGTEIGTPFADLYGVGDTVFDIALTPNRADCAGIRGIARDLAAAGLGTLKDINEDAEKGTFESKTKVKIEDKDGCPLFLGRAFKGIKNGPSPQWLQDKLKAIGLRPISTLVDITNLMTMEYGRPLHVYDIGKLKGDIVVREAKEGESFDALNDKSYTTRGGEVAITDDSGLIGLGGIVGGESTGCDENTTDVFLESAYFNPMRTARTGRDLGVESDARYRFDRGVDPEFTRTGIEIATRIILELCGGEASDIVQAGDMPAWKRKIEHNPAYVEQLAGFAVPEKEQIDILTALGFTVEGKGPYQVTPPSWRGDIEGKADLVEEIVRISGFDQIPSLSVRPLEAVGGSAETPTLSRTRLARTALAARGMNECVTWSFMGKHLAAQFSANDNADALTLSNPISSELDQMRPSILPNLIEAAGRNAARGFADVALCEVGPAFRSTKPDGQDMIAAGIRAGNIGPKHWAGSNSDRAADVFDAKADAMAVLEACGAPAANAQISTDAPGYYHPGRSGVLRLGPNVLAQFGEIHPAILEEMDIKTPIVGFEVFLQNIPEARQKTTSKKLLNLPPLQHVSRDFAFIVDEDVASYDLIRCITGADKNLITDVAVFDVYQGKGVDAGKKSVALKVTIQPGDHTLTDSELEGLTKKIIDNVEKKTGGVLR